MHVCFVLEWPPSFMANPPVESSASDEQRRNLPAYCFGMMYATWSWSCCLWKNKTWSLNGVAVRFPPPLVVVSTTAAASSHPRCLPSGLPCCRRAVSWGRVRGVGCAPPLGGEEEERVAHRRAAVASGLRDRPSPPPYPFLSSRGLVERAENQVGEGANERVLELVSFGSNDCALLGHQNTAISS